jgi:hypothetical protein
MSAGSEAGPLAKADGWREGLVERFDGDMPFALVEIAFDRATAELAWAENVPDGLPRRDGRPEQPGRYGDLDAVDFSTHAVVVWSSGQSGTCPAWLADISTRDDAVEIHTAQSGQICTDDYRPYRMLLAVERDRLPDPDEFPVSNVIVDGRSGGSPSLVDRYPAGG